MAARKSDFERTEVAKEKTGVEIKGIKAINPVNGEKIPVWVSDYVLMSYGTGAIMAVPAHDDRDWEFAKKFNLPIIEVVAGGADVQKEPFTDVEDGVMVNSGFLTGLRVKDAIEEMKKWLEKNKIGERKVNYKLRDWVFSRQRYWGEPIPLVHCEKCGWVSIPESELPLTLPEIKDFKPAENGESPLAKATDWINTTCPKCGGAAKRETDTMPQWAGSSWYFLRYIDPKNNKEFADKELLKYWLPIDWYNGGMEHTTLHLLYSRFWHRFLYDLGLVPTMEPYQKRTSQGMILGENNEKMSKSRGNVVNPDDIINEYGTDTMRTYEMFMGAFDQAAAWSQQGVKGSRKFLERIWNLQEFMTDSKEISPKLEKDINFAIKKVSEDYEKMKFNIAIAAMMSLVNTFYDVGEITKEDMKILLVLLNPVAPHITEEIWYKNNFGGYVHEQKWPEFDPSKLIEEEIEVPVQINGKLKTVVKVNKEAEQNEILDIAKSELKEYLKEKEIVKVIFVPGKIFNIVIK
jgi:leucyl-tRNA synthetase